MRVTWSFWGDDVHLHDCLNCTVVGCFPHICSLVCSLFELILRLKTWFTSLVLIMDRCIVLTPPLIGFTLVGIGGSFGIFTAPFDSQSTSWNLDHTMVNLIIKFKKIYQKNTLYIFRCNLFACWYVQTLLDLSLIIQSKSHNWPELYLFHNFLHLIFPHLMEHFKYFWG